MKKKSRVVWLENDCVFVVKLGKTTNNKISDGSALVQTYTFDYKQWLLASTSKGFKMKEFFALDENNCLDCPYSGNQGNYGCYTHKFMQYSGFLSMLRSIKHTDLTPLTTEKRKDIYQMCFNRYVRFGTYGEPSLLPIDLVKGMSNYAKSWTGYTHQWAKPWAKEYGNWFMASVHNQAQADQANDHFRSFISTTIGDESAVQCPASKEAGYKSNCAKCGLCSGTQGKGKVDIKILEH